MSKIICVDAGHGGDKTGARAEGVLEKDLALRYSLDLAQELTNRLVPATLTRTRDEDVGLTHRARAANCADADIFTSVHFNWSGSADAQGIWIVYAAVSTRGKEIAEQVAERLDGIAVPDDSPWVGNRRLTVLRKTRMPALLIEYGFLSNEEERQRLLSLQYRREITRKTADALVDVLTD